MKAITALFTVVLLTSTITAQADWQTTYDTLLQKYVKAEGVPYKSWHAHTKDRAALKQVVDGVAAQSLKGMNKNEQLAFYINAYNAWILQTVLVNYPLKSIKDIGLFVFRKNNLVVAGKKTSFHKLENDVIRRKFNESRIHFALNCASASCPPLHNRAFTGATLDTTLSKLAKDFVANPVGVWSRGKGKDVHVSKIFDWYEADFKKEAGSILGYVGKYRGKPYPSGAKLSFQDYDWSLNESK